MTFDCLKCGKSFKTSTLLTRHVKHRKTPCDKTCNSCGKRFSSVKYFTKHQCEDAVDKDVQLAQIDLEKTKIVHETKRKEIEFKTEKLKLKKIKEENALQLGQPKQNRHEQLLIALTDFDLKYLTAIENPLNSHTKIVYEIIIKTDADGFREIETNEVIERRRKFVEKAEMAITPLMMAETIKCCVYNLHQEFHIMNLLAKIHTEKDTPRLHSIKYRDADQNMLTFERPRHDQTVWKDNTLDQAPRKLEDHARRLVSFILQSATNKLKAGYINGGVTKSGMVLRKMACLSFPLDDQDSCVLFENVHYDDTEIIVDTVPTSIIEECPDDKQEDVAWLFDSFHSRRKRLTNMMNGMQFETNDTQKFLQLCQ
jgi:transcription elongation factor Elf1